MDARAGLGGYVLDANHGGMQLGRAKQLAAAGLLQWVAILVAEAGEKQRPEVTANKQVVDPWRSELNPFGCNVGVWVVHGTDPQHDASHYQGWKHVDLAVCNCEREYVEDPARSGRFLAALGSHPPLVLSTNGNPAQKPLDYRAWEQAGAWLATQAYWQFNVVNYLTPKTAHKAAYLPSQINIGPSATSWWYRVWLRRRGNYWAQSVGEISTRGRVYVELLKGGSMYHAEIRLAEDGGRYLTSRTLLANGSRDVGKVLGFFPKQRITPHISNEDGDTGRPSPSVIKARVAECPTRKVAVGVFTLDNASDDELRAVQAGMAA